MNKRHSSSECNVKSIVSKACNDSVCLMRQKSLINDVQDDCVSMNVNVLPAKKSASKGPSAKSRHVGNLIKRIRNTTNSLTPRNYLKFCTWKPTGREFLLQDGKMIVVKSKVVETFFDCDTAFTSNPMEPNSKRFPNAKSSVLRRLSKFVFGSSTRVGPST